MKKTTITHDALVIVNPTQLEYGSMVAIQVVVQDARGSLSRMAYTSRHDGCSRFVVESFVVDTRLRFDADAKSRLEPERYAGTFGGGGGGWLLDR